jgi:hypothetical protein
VTRPPIEERVIHYFLAMGARVNQDSPNPGTLSFLFENDCVLVSILTVADTIQRNRIIDTLLRISSLRSQGTQVYVAAPKLLGATIDAQVLRSSGIGLLLYDDRRIEETIKPEIIHAPPERRTPGNPTPDLTLLSELTTLKSKYTEIERNMQRMIAEFKTLQENIMLTHGPNPKASSDVSFEPIRSPETLFQGDMLAHGPLPSFFTNNPWLDVLSKRGKVEATPLAG